MKQLQVLIPETFYHVYNRAVGAETMFRSDHDYEDFLTRWRYYLSPVCQVYAYCLIPNHFHTLIRIRPAHEINRVLKTNDARAGLRLSRQFANCFGSYAMSFNWRYARKGKLFMLPFKRKAIESEVYFSQLVYYIHGNPMHHWLSDNPGAWKYSSYKEISGNHPTWIERHEVLNWFGGREKFIQAHDLMGLLARPS